MKALLCTDGLVHGEKSWSTSGTGRGMLDTRAIGGPSSVLKGVSVYKIDRIEAVQDTHGCNAVVGRLQPLMKGTNDIAKLCDA